MIKKGDTIIVRTGKEKGTKAKVARVLPNADRVVIEGVGVVKKHQKARTQGGKGEVVTRAMPIHVSNVSLFCEKCKKGTRMGSAMTSGGTKSRVCAVCKTVI